MKQWRVKHARDEAVAALEGAGAGDADGTAGNGAALGALDGSALGVGAGASS